VQSVEIGGQGEVIDEDLLGQQRLTTVPSQETNETIAIFKKDTLDIASQGFEVKSQEGNVWVKGAAVMTCIIVWLVAKKIK
jgi:hypothetical protein